MSASMEIVDRFIPNGEREIIKLSSPAPGRLELAYEYLLCATCGAMVHPDYGTVHHEFHVRLEAAR